MEKQPICHRPSVIRKPRSLAPLALLALALPTLDARAAPLPPPPRLGEIPATANATLFLELVVNQRSSGQVVPVQMQDGHYFVAATDLSKVGLQLPADSRGKVQVDAVADMRAEYDGSRLRLLLDVPPHWLPEQQLGRSQVFERTPAQSSFGALLNYQAYSNAPDHGLSYTSVWNELRLFGSYGVLSNTGTYQHPYSNNSPLGRRYLRHDTYWRHSDENRILTYELGDFINNPLAWNTPVRMAGVQISRDFSLRPDVITYPLPQFSGEAAVPTTVDLFIDGYKNSSENVNPGPFSITNVPFITGAGEAVVVTTDALGRQVTTTMPFYISSSLLRPGLSDFSFATGVLRRDYGLKNFSYGTGVANGSYRYGVNDYFTLESHAEAASSFALGGLGGVFRLGNLGTLNAAYSGSRQHGEEGNQVAAGYQYTRSRFNVGVQHTRRSSDYGDLSSHDNNYRFSRRSTQVNASVSPAQLGSFGVGYFDIKAHDNSRTRLLNLSWSKSLWADSNLLLSANREIGGDDWAFGMQLMIPFGGRSSVSTSFERSADKLETRRIDYRRSVPSEGGFGWDLAYTDSDSADAYRQASLTWRGDRLQVQGGVYGSSRNYNRWVDVSGSLVLMNASVHAANRVGDSFVLVSTDGQEDIPVRYENRLVGSTDSDGHLLVPWSTSYYNAKYEIDPLGLPSSFDTPKVEQRVAVKAGSGYLLRFPVSRVAAASIVLHDAQGTPLPVGSAVQGDNGQSDYIGWGGLVYMERLKPHNRLQVALPEGGTCEATFDFETQADEITQIGPLECR
ncbi:fimbria/pilus outer membrane usher protein [Billgrantia endophytica]|uniref:Fimbrial assembly protein n=1 Tax=Billgrantia endophytica TaxID=2033802 RepID=A0A2N7U0P2_9GAMM|nr:fimbria/pilus outer membrane usher protein [Halomonas endophytica]PMR73991.1 fimbrial assembly protein [Halomonas endophytica]